MTLKTLIEKLTNRLESSEAESRAYEAETENGRDIFESSRAQSFFDGHASALREVIEDLERITSEENSELAASC